MKENIEEDMKRLEKISECFNYSMWEEDTNALKHILSDYKRVLKENEELKETNKVISIDITKGKILQQDCLRTVYGIPIGEIPKIKRENQELKHKYDKALSDLVKFQKENEELKQSLIINKKLYEELCNKNNELKRDNELARQALKEQCDIADERNQLLKENKDWQKAYQEEKDKQFELLRENQKLNEYIILAPNLDEMTAMKYRNITEEAYIKGRAEEQQKAEQIIYEHYIPKQKIKDKIEELKEEYKTELEKNSTRAFILKCQITILEDLLEEKGE